MKRTILVMLLVVMVATPCLAQEVEPEGIFSIEGTRWGYCLIGFGILCYGLFCLPQVGWGCDYNDWAFYEGDVLRCDGYHCYIDSDFSYIDTPLVSIFSHIQTKFLRGGHYEFAILQPSGFGVYTNFLWEYGGKKGFSAGLLYRIGIMYKVDDDWSPYDQPIPRNSAYPCPEGMVCIDGYCQ